MKPALIGLLMVIAMIVPRLACAGDSLDEFGPPAYNDVDNGQALQLAAYALAPLGYVLEWTVTRPMHSLATDSPIAPVLSGDTQIRYFGETNNADMLPPGTFAPFQVPANPNTIDSSGAGTSTYYQQRTNTLPPVTKTQRYEAEGYVPGSGGQSAFH